MKHADFGQYGAQAFHQWCFVQTADPALDPTNEVAAGKGWINSSTLRLYVRNLTNTAWLTIGND